MLKAAVGEWILSLVTSRERASATVGDCLEDTHGAFAFWWFVLRTAVSACLREAWESRWRLLGLATFGVVMEMFLFLLFVLCTFVLSVHKVMSFPVFMLMALVVGQTVIPFLAGRMVAQLSGGRELSAGFVLFLLRAAFALAGFTTALFWTSPALISSLLVAANPLFVMAGALSWRARHPRTA